MDYDKRQRIVDIQNVLFFNNLIVNVAAAALKYIALGQHCSSYTLMQFLAADLLVSSSSKGHCLGNPHGLTNVHEKQL